MTLATARKAAAEVRRKIEAGIDPIEERREAKRQQDEARAAAAAAAERAVLTFERVVNEWIADRLAGGYWAKNPRPPPKQQSSHFRK